VTRGAPRASASWRALGDGVAALLGVNLWVSVILLPGVFVGAWSSWLSVAVAALPLLVLAFSLWQRSEQGLLLGFPTVLLVPAALHPEMVAPHVYGGVRFVLVALSLGGYLFGVVYLTRPRAWPAPGASRPLSSSQQPMAERWRRRYRVYRGMAIAALVVPCVLVYVVNFRRHNLEFLRQLFPGKVQAYTALLNLGVVGLWLALFSWVFLGIMRPHRTGDTDLTAELAALAKEARRGRPRPGFYVGVAVALTSMLLLLLLRHW
jgi:hypothetical protein